MACASSPAAMDRVQGLQTRRAWRCKQGLQGRLNCHPLLLRVLGLSPTSIPRTLPSSPFNQQRSSHQRFARPLLVVPPEHRTAEVPGGLAAALTARSPGPARHIRGDGPADHHARPACSGPKAAAGHLGWFQRPPTLGSRPARRAPALAAQLRDAVEPPRGWQVAPGWVSAQSHASHPQAT